MKLFETPVIEMTAFATEDVITASTSFDDDGFNDEVVMP